MSLPSPENTQRITHTFVSSFANFNTAGRFQFNFREPIRNVESSKINGVTIKNFVGINLSYLYFLRTDFITGARDVGYFNGKSDKIAFVIPNPLQIAGQGLTRYNNNDTSFITTREHYLHSIWFELLNQQGTIINPPDVGWSFTVEIELKINI